MHMGRERAPSVEASPHRTLEESPRSRSSPALRTIAMSPSASSGVSRSAWMSERRVTEQLHRQASEVSRLTSELIEWESRCQILASELAKSEASLSSSKKQNRQLRKAVASQARRPSADRPPMAMQPAPNPAFTPGPDMIRLLLVEDDPFQADAIMILCQQCGYRAQSATNAAEALEMIKASPEINLVLSDVMMEGTSGFQLLCSIRAIKSSVAVSHPRHASAAHAAPDLTPRPSPHHPGDHDLCVRVDRPRRPVHPLRR